MQAGQGGAGRLPAAGGQRAVTVEAGAGWSADDDPLFIPDELLAYASAAELALYEALLAREASELPDAPKPLPDSPGALAARVTGGTELQAPHLNLIDEIHQDCRATPNARHVLSLPPRLGKTQRGVRWAVPWHLMHDPWARFLYVTYGRDLSAMSSRWVRDMLDTQDLRAVVDGEERRIHPRRDVRSVTEWELAGFPDSGMIAVGLDGPLTGKGGHLICDDLLKNAAEADSKAAKEAAYKALTETLMPRVDEGCFAFVIMARWAEDDPIGRLKVDDPNGWNFVNVPELCVDPATDPIGRARVDDPICPAMRSLERSLKLRATLPRFEAQNQGRPERVKRSGGIFARDKIDRNRWVAADPATFVRVAVGIDPSASDSDESDEAGIIAAARTLSGQYAVIEDASDRMEPDRWARVALLVALRHNADVLAYEQNLVKKMMRKVIDGAWDRLVTDLATLRAALEAVNLNVDPAARDDLDLLLHGRRRPAEGGVDADEWEVEPVPDADQLLALLADPGRRLVKPRIEGVAAKVGKELRAEPVSQLYAQDAVHHVGNFPTFERQLTTWRPGQGSPDRMDAGVHVLTLLADLGTVVAESAAGQPLPKPATSPAARRAGMRTSGYGRPAGR